MRALRAQHGWEAEPHRPSNAAGCVLAHPFGTPASQAGGGQAGSAEQVVTQNLVLPLGAPS